MQTFRDTVTLKVWAYDPDVIVTQSDGVYSFKTASGVALNAPTTLQPYVVPAPPSPTLAQQASVALSAGLTLTLSGTLAFAATLFPTDSVTTGKIGDMAAMAARGVLPLGAAAYPMKDASGAWHTFTAGQYQAVAGAIAAYAAALILIADGNPLGSTSLPAASISLTV